MKRILINASQPEEIRTALVDGQTLYDLDIEIPYRGHKKGNIYKAQVTHVEPSLEAAFVNYGADRHGFLPFKDINPTYLGADGEVGQNIKEGMDLIVQVIKEERNNKGASLSTFVTLIGRYLVLLPNNPKGGGISRRIEGNQRQELRQKIEKLELSEEHSIIVRTFGMGCSVEDLQWDINFLLQLWGMINSEFEKSSAPHFLFQESNVIIRSLRDYLRPNIGEVIIDEPSAYNLACAFINQVMPEYSDRIKLYNESVPLFSHYVIEQQIEKAFERRLKLPSGGSIVVDITEALTTIDVNSARSNQASDLEKTALNTNLEAADETARQLRLRDIGGLFVIDFIDMQLPENRLAVEERMRKAIKMDRARIQTNQISIFGLMELSRQRLRPSLEETIFDTCPQCDGQGRVRKMRSQILSILRAIEGDAQKLDSQEIQVICSIEISTFLTNEKRAVIDSIEKMHAVRILIIPQITMERHHYEIRRVGTQSNSIQDVANLQNQYTQSKTLELIANTASSARPVARPAIENVFPPKREAERKGFLYSLLTSLGFMINPKEGASKPVKTAKGKRQQQQKKATTTRSSKPSTRRSTASGEGRRQQPRKNVDSMPKKTSSRTKKTEQSSRARPAREKSSTSSDQRSRRIRERKEPTGKLQEIAISTASQNPVTSALTEQPDSNEARKKTEQLSKLNNGASQPVKEIINTAEVSVIHEKEASAVKREPPAYRRPANDPRNRQVDNTKE